MHPVPGHRAGRGVGQVLEERSDPLETMACDGLVGVFETQECDGRLAVLPDTLRLDAQPLLERNEPLEVRPGPVRFLRTRCVRLWLGIAPEEETALEGGTDNPGGHPLGEPRR